MNRLKEISFFHKVSQHELALLAQVHQSRISLIENELVVPKEEKERLAEALGVKTEEIFSENAAKDNNPKLRVGLNINARR